MIALDCALIVFPCWETVVDSELNAAALALDANPVVPLFTVLSSEVIRDALLVVAPSTFVTRVVSVSSAEALAFVASPVAVLLIVDSSVVVRVAVLVTTPSAEVTRLVKASSAWAEAEADLRPTAT